MAAMPASAALPPVAIRWTIGDVSPRGFEALRLSLWGACHVFGPGADYVVCVNTLALDEARERTGPVPAAIEWRTSRREELPGFLARAFGATMAEGVAWKLAPLRLFPDRHEVALDNDCILWELPPSLAQWLGESGTDPLRCLMAEDVRTCHGRFAAQCPRQPVNSGIRGLPPGFDLAAALQGALHDCEAAAGSCLQLSSELDEQGLQAAALCRARPLTLVRVPEVTICSPFHPHLPHLGTCGAHFVGLNARHIPWDYYDQPADAWMAEHWERHRAELARRTGTPDLSGPPGDSGPGLASPPSGSSPPPSRRRQAALLSPSVPTAAASGRIPSA